MLRLSPTARRQAVVLGGLYGVAQILQTAGLAHTPASVSGFITGMYVVATPLFAAVLLRNRITRHDLGRRAAGVRRPRACSPSTASRSGTARR